MTALTNDSDIQVKVNLEIVFDPVENKNKHNTIIYDHVHVAVFDVKNGMFSNTTFEQRGQDKTTAMIRLDDVMVGVSVEYENEDYSSKSKKTMYGVSFLDHFEVAGLVRIEGGKWVVKSTTNMRAKCGTAFERVFPFYQLNQTHTLDLQPTICEVDGDWSSFILKCKDLALVFLLISIFLTQFQHPVCSCCHNYGHPHSYGKIALTNDSNKEVKVNLEIVFDPVENKTKHNTIIYDHVYVRAFDIKNEMFSNTAFEQRGQDKTVAVIRLNGVKVRQSVEDVDKIKL
ncbi:hypothetical protein FNV43_RR01094 [Rhamnella rubrinervis]|uniref:Uncharacterized protein n=1 Tax=Rhamnella rubrinervis TaxID=2594499 RepID=A0A8K0HQC1_9ROSA|nr:hypothetical protein FNV43_RR01094 [Rhamnella rubrinervis]